MPLFMLNTMHPAALRSALTVVEVHSESRSRPMRAPLAVTALGTGLFLLLRLPVSDLQAATVRADALDRGVGQTYWFSWFGGATPGRYSVITPWVTHLIGVPAAAACAVLAVVFLTGHLLAGFRYQLSATSLVAITALANLWSGRIAFCLGAAFALAGIMFLRRGLDWAAGTFSLIAILASPLAGAFVLLATSGLLFTGTAWRKAVWRQTLVAGLALLLLAAIFGVPGPTPFDRSTAVKVLVALLVLQLVRLPRHIRIGLLISTALCVCCYFLPIGVGGNLGRYALFVVPPVVWAFSSSPRRFVCLAVAPAVIYAAGLTAIDVRAATQASARSGYYDSLRAALSRQPGLASYRVEALDTPTHRSSAEVSRYANLARGWDLQADVSANPLFYGAEPLTPMSYRSWLDELAVAWVAVPDDLNAHNRAEAALIASGLPYLTETWHNRHWTLYSVRGAQPIVSAPASVISSSPAALLVDVPKSATVALRIRSSPYLRVAPVDGRPASAQLSRRGSLQVALTVDRPGIYSIAGAFSFSGLLSALRASR
jgi:hypothetical protein